MPTPTIACQYGMPAINWIGMAIANRRMLDASVRVTRKIAEAKRRASTPNRFSSSW
ncbi:hypothetical protein D3C83_329300 [compost metagenome]